MSEIWFLAAMLVVVALLVVTVGLLIRFLRAREPARTETRGAAAGAPDEALPAGADLARAQREARRAQRLAAIATTLDLDEIVDHLVEAALAECRADAAGIALRQKDGSSLVRAHGFADGESPPSLRDRWDDVPARAITLQYTYDPSQFETRPMRTGLFVPLASDADEQLGTVAAYWRQPHEPTPEEVSALEELARQSARLIKIARRFKEANELAVLDQLTRLYNRAFFYDELAREVKRATRYGRSLALIVFDFDGFKAINDEIGHLGGDNVLAEVAERLRSVLRGADVACRIGGDEFAVILPEATLADAEQLYRRLQIALEGRPIGRAERLTISGGIAEAQPDDDAVAVFQRADHALFRAKREGGNRFVRANPEPPPLSVRFGEGGHPPR